MPVHWANSPSKVAAQRALHSSISLKPSLLPNVWWGLSGLYL